MKNLSIADGPKQIRIVVFIGFVQACFMQCICGQNLEPFSYLIHPLLRNAAYAGSANSDYGPAGRILMNYSFAFRNSGGLPQSTNISWDQHVPGLGGGVAAVYSQQKNLYLSHSSLSGSYGYLMPIRRLLHFRIALQGSWMHTEFDPQKIPAGDPLVSTVYLVNQDRRTWNRFNFGTAVQWNTAHFSGGASYGNTLKFDSAEWRHLSPGFSRSISMNFLYRIRCKRVGMEVSPMSWFQRVGTTWRWDFGANFGKDNFCFGLHGQRSFSAIRNAAIVGLLGYRYRSFALHYQGALLLHNRPNDRYYLNGISLTYVFATSLHTKCWRPLRVPSHCCFF